MNSPALPVTVIVPIKNEEKNLAGCLSALGAFERIIVVDSGSTDQSAVIAREHGAEFVQFEWNGEFPKKRNWALRNLPLETEWVLFLDADECVTPEFVRELQTTLAATAHNGFWLTYHNFFLGRRLRFGDRFSKLALVRRGCGEYERIDEIRWSALDMEVHEHVIVNGSVGQVRAPILHDDFKGLHAYYERHNSYSSWEAERYLWLQTNGTSERQSALTSRQRLKYALLASPFFPPLYFLASFIGRAGFLDGSAGFRFAVGKMFYFYQIGFKIAEKRAALHQQLISERDQNLPKVI